MTGVEIGTRAWIELGAIVGDWTGGSWAGLNWIALVTVDWITTVGDNWIFIPPFMSTTFLIMVKQSSLKI